MDNQETKQCPFCGQMIHAQAKKCKYCKNWLIEAKKEDLQETSGKNFDCSEKTNVKEQQNGFQILKYARILGQIIFVIIIIALLGWILFVDIPNVQNNNGYGAEWVTFYAKFHSLLLIWATIMLLIFKK